MNSNKNNHLKQLVRCNRSSYVFPFVSFSHKGGPVKPLFRIRYAKMLAVEFGGRYDAATSTIIIPVDGVDREYRAINAEIKGKRVNLYPIGPDWGWEVINDAKVFEAFWGNDFWVTGKFLVTEDFFSDDRGYEADEISAVGKLNVGGHWESNNYGPRHTATRLA